MALPAAVTEHNIHYLRTELDRMRHDLQAMSVQHQRQALSAADW